MKDNQRQSYKKFILELIFLALLILNVDCISQTNRNPYQIMGISQKATPEQIKQRFRYLSKQYHPDKLSNKENQSSSSSHQLPDTKQFEDIVAAYQILKQNNFKPTFKFPQQDDQYWSSENNNKRFDFNAWKNKQFFQMEFGEWWDEEGENNENTQNIQKQKENNQFDFENFLVNFLTWMFVNKNATIGAFFISIGIVSLFKGIKKSKQKSIDYQDIRSIDSDSTNVSKQYQNTKSSKNTKLQTPVGK